MRSRRLRRYKKCSRNRNLENQGQMYTCWWESSYNANKFILFGNGCYDILVPKWYLIANICCPCKNYHGYVPFVVITIYSFLHSWLITGFVARVTRQVPHAEQELFTLRKHLVFVFIWLHSRYMQSSLYINVNTWVLFVIPVEKPELWHGRWCLVFVHYLQQQKVMVI